MKGKIFDWVLAIIPGVLAFLSSIGYYLYSDPIWMTNALLSLMLMNYTLDKVKA